MSLRSQLEKVRHSHFSVTFPQERVVLVTLNRVDKLNSIAQSTSREIQQIWELFDQDESLWVGIITGSGRAFCTGADLHEWNEMNRFGVVNKMTAPGLAGLPRRNGKKPIIAAVNGICMGGGFEMVANCDLVIASSSATFALPEVKRGIVPVAGCLPRLTGTLGLQRTMDLALTGRTISAQTLYEWGLISRLVSPDHNLLDAAIALAAELCGNSPEALIVGRRGIRLGWEYGDVEQAVSTLEEEWYPRLVKGHNFREGIQAFTEKRPPQWMNSKL
ncbi:Enoyl-CoA hydratase [Penicillium ucsense]|uniref:Enoyl-CoA hydratase n=1 Tax=Penicillium ucsense TaxID=2839758 RepID=A0A8J8W6L2_9EURO|nr:Enoyl-CoA hydratase [Penicillium ucsense]KAF7737887.1 Enoyl-CoA hydratase [Penicillium ucsense]